MALKEFKRIANGELLDDLAFVQSFKQWLGLKKTKDEAKQGVGDERLGQGGIMDDIGLTIVILSAVLIIAVILTFIALKLAKKYNVPLKW